MRKTRAIPLFVLSTSTLVSSIGYGTWIFNHPKELDTDIITKSSTPVCYIKGKENIKYVSIEKALDVAANNNGSDVIMVFPFVDYTISKECKLGTGDTLLIPYSSENNPDSPTGDVNYSGFGDNNPDKPQLD